MAELGYRDGIAGSSVDCLFAVPASSFRHVQFAFSGLGNSRYFSVLGFAGSGNSEMVWKTLLSESGKLLTAYFHLSGCDNFLRLELQNCLKICIMMRVLAGLKKYLNKLVFSSHIMYTLAYDA
jgi:hypothetical protein